VAQVVLVGRLERLVVRLARLARLAAEKHPAVLLAPSR
jgi:hypothetical protein